MKKMKQALKLSPEPSELQILPSSQRALYNYNFFLGTATLSNLKCYDGFRQQACWLIFHFFSVNRVLILWQIQDAGMSCVLWKGSLFFLNSIFSSVLLVTVLYRHLWPKPNHLSSIFQCSHCNCMGPWTHKPKDLLFICTLDETAACYWKELKWACT